MITCYHVCIIYTQVYPTSVRAFAMSLCAGFGRIGSITAPYIAQVCDDQCTGGQAILKFDHILDLHN